MFYLLLSLLQSQSSIFAFVAGAFGVFPKCHCLYWQLEVFLLHFLITDSWFQVLDLDIWSTLSWFLYIVKCKGLLSFFCIWMPSFPGTFYRRDCPFSNVCCWQLHWRSVDYRCVDYFWLLYSVPLVNIVVFMLIPCCFGYHSFVVCFEVRYCECLQLCSFCWRLCWSYKLKDCLFSFHLALSPFFLVVLEYKLRASCLPGRQSYCLSHSTSPISVKNAIGILMGIKFNLLFWKVWTL
jgi:hypothetical protein